MQKAKNISFFFCRFINQIKVKKEGTLEA